MQTVARTLFFATLATLTFGLVGPLPVSPAAGPTSPARPPQVVYLGHDLPDEALIALGSAVAAADPRATLLLDSVKLSPYLKICLEALAADRVVPIGGFSEGVPEVEKRLDVQLAGAMHWTRGPPLELWKSLFRQADDVVVCPAEPRSLLLQSACLAGTLKAPLFVVHGHLGETARLQGLLDGRDTRRVHLAGAARKLGSALVGYECIKLADEQAVAAARLRLLIATGDIQSVVVANPADTGEGMGRMSALAPWIAVQKRAPLLLTAKDGKNVDEVVQRALRSSAVRAVDYLILVGNLQAIPVVQRPNPIPTDKDTEIEMEPLTPTGTQPFTFATGRLFHDEIGGVPLMLARQRLLAESRGLRKAVVVSNPGNSLPFLETFSRNTAQELRNVGYETTTRFGNEIRGADVRKLMTEHDIFLWEGHHNTLIKEYEMPTWLEPMPSSLVFLQSCLALKDYKVQPLLSRGAVAVVGSSTRTYSGSGGACSLAFFNALLYEDQSLGGSLRQAKNFLLAYALLKEKRLGKEATRTGANMRASWSFTLWGDPTFHMPRPDMPEYTHPPVRHEVVGNTIVLTLPDDKHDPVSNDKFKVQMPANGRLAGLVRKEKEEDGQPLVPFVFAEVYLPKAKKGQTPVLTCKLPSTHWVFCWDERRRTGYVLATPRASDKDELRFHVRYQSAEIAVQKRETVTIGN